MLKTMKCVLMAIADLIAPATVVLMSLAAFDYIKNCRWIGAITCLIGSMIPVMLVYTHHFREDDVIEWTSDNDEE